MRSEQTKSKLRKRVVRVVDALSLLPISHPRLFVHLGSYGSIGLYCTASFAPHSMSSTSALISHFEATARSHHSQYDCSHDIHHIQRVVAQSLSICRSINASDPSSTSPKGDEVVVHLAALAHDLIDKKYLPPGSSVTAAEHLAPLWVGHEEVITEEQRRLVERIVDNVSYSKEVKRIAKGEETDWHRECRELHW